MKKVLPKRKHIGCDPMCQECQDWLEAINQEVKPVVNEALKVFWNMIESQLPECEPGYVKGIGAEEFHSMANETVMHWAAASLPTEVLPAVASVVSIHARRKHSRDQLSLVLDGTVTL